MLLWWNGSDFLGRAVLPGPVHRPGRLAEKPVRTVKQSGLWYGVALGLMVVGGYSGGRAIIGLAPDLWLLVALLAICVGLGWFSEGVVDGVRVWNSDRLKEKEREIALKEREAAMRRTAALTPARLTRLVPVNGGVRHIEMPIERPARWLNWQRASEELLLWYLETGALTVDALVGRGTRKAFSDRTAWSLMLDEWHRVGLARKENGVPTVLLKTPEEVRLMLERGDVDWTLDVEPPSIRPAPSAEVLEHRPIARNLA